MIERHYTTREIADLLSVCTETVLRLAQRGELASVYVGAERRYPESAVQDYLARSKARARRPANAGVVELAATRNDRSSRRRRPR